MTNKQINPNLRKLAELTYNPNLKIDKTIFEKQEQELITQTPNIKGFIYIPSVNLYFQDKRTHLGKSWNETQKVLVKEKLAMPTPYQFRAFLKYLRDTNNNLYNEITEIREPWRANWINAKFEKRKNGLYMISENVLENRECKTIEQKLDNVLMEDKTPGISIDDWLDSNEKHGLPKAKINKGKLYFWYPRDEAVARFVADSDGADLYCYRDPDLSYSSLGVFACAEGTRAKN